MQHQCHSHSHPLSDRLRPLQTWRTASHASNSRQQRNCKVHAEGAGWLKKFGRVVKEKATGDLDRIFKGTSKTRERLGLVDELLAYWRVEDAEDTLMELEDLLISVDFGPKTSSKVVDIVRTAIKKGKVKSGQDIRKELQQAIKQLLAERSGPKTDLLLVDEKPSVIMVVGVNGSGKTTTIGKLAAKLQEQGAQVMLVAGDTFRAAATEQLGEWARRSSSQLQAADPAKIAAGSARPDKVLSTAMDAAAKGGLDVAICDTSGRLHNNWKLMEELAKCKAAIQRRLPQAPHEVLLVLDGTNGLNMLNQAREFHETVGVTGLVLTKLDGTSKGGAVVSVVDEIGVPIKFVGVGETIADLQSFDAGVFVEALFPLNPKS